jgi:hypothetical protein
MMITTVTFDSQTDEPLDLSGADVLRLHQAVRAVVNRYFTTEREASAAQAEHRSVEERLKSNPKVPLASHYESARTALYAREKALKWESCVRDINGEITPYRFSIRFSPDY